MRLILFVIFVFGIFNTNLYCKDNIEADAKIFLEDSILTINVTIHNKSDIEIYIPITEWYLEGDFVRNTALPVPQTYLINEIIFYPENSEEPKSVFDAVCDYSTNKMPTLIQVSKDSSVNLTIIKKFNNSKNFFIKDVNYTFELGLSYSVFICYTR